MRPKFVNPGLALIALAILLCWAGCSSDSTLQTSMQPGVETDPGFLIVQEHVNNYLDSADVAYSMALNKIYPGDDSQIPKDHEILDTDAIPGGGASKLGSPVFLEGYSNGWHWTEYAQYYTDYTYTYTDSVTFMNDDLYLYLSDGLDYLRYIKHWEVENDATTATHTDLSGYYDLEFSRLDTDTLSISGFDNYLVEWHYSSVDSTVDAVFGFEATIADVEIVRGDDDLWADGCPCSGTIGMDVNVSYTLTAESFPIMTARSWEITVSIINGVATVSAESNQQYWTYQYTMCTAE
ncbi:MAG: hypothetical protein GY865_08925 [candidate division Zixibacteria bacterium]|nr:hypothetical protein [candidate division Zixibacteria bacterium]